jgi:hypothetical protein
MGGWIEVVDNTGNQRVMAKFDQTTGSEVREWSLYLDSSENLIFSVIDESANTISLKTSDAPLSTGWHFVTVTYDPSAGSGATFANGLTLYVDGIPIAGTATNIGSYTAMENLNNILTIGANIKTTGSYGDFFAGDMGFLFITKETLTAIAIWRLYMNSRFYYNL